MSEDAPVTTTPARRTVTETENRAANRTWWDGDAKEYQRLHGAFLGDVDLVWGPEGLREAEARLLGDVRGTRVLELGCGAAAGARWLQERGADAVGLDLSSGMLGQAQEGAERTGVYAPLVQADALALPFAAETFDSVCTAFGVVPFVTDTEAVMREVFRVLRPGGKWVYATYHPMRWIFKDDPGEGGLHAVNPYFDRRPYVELDSFGVPTYLEQHRTLGDHVRALVAAGFVLHDLIEPEWPPGHEAIWGQWSPLRGRLFPSTAIFVSYRPM